MMHAQPSATGNLTVVHSRREDQERAIDERMQRLRKTLVRDDTAGHFNPARERYLYDVQRFAVPAQQRLLTWLRDNVNPGIPRAWYRMVLGHDLHVSTWAELFVKHYHATEPDPFTGNLGWTENVGLASTGKVTIAFRNFETAQMVTETADYGEFQFHEVGTSATAEANTDTALIATSGIARVNGSQVDGTGTYTTAATVTADTSETWQEHGVFNASTGPTLLDRSVLSPTVVVVNLDTCLFTYVLTKNAEA
jgi:hypothetical protein